MANKKWPASRRRQLVELREMLFELSNVNAGSGFLEKVERASRVASRLTALDLDRGRDSFIAFLTMRAHGEDARP